MIVTARISADLQTPGYPPIVHAVQGEQYSRRIDMNLYDGGVAWTVPGGVFVAMRYSKPDGTSGYYDTLPDGTQAWSVTGNTVSVFVAPQMLTVPGVICGQLEIIQNQSILASFPIRLKVAENVAARLMKSEDYTNWLEWMVAELDRRIAEGNFVGPRGDTGKTPVISVAATVDENTGTPSVSVSKSGTAESPKFTLAFKNLKGQTGNTGATGATGKTGPTGATGAPATLVSKGVRYQVSDDGKTPPTGTWLEDVPNVPQGKFLWAQITMEFNSGSPVVTHIPVRFGMDGKGSVVSVAGIGPDPDGNVPLTAEKIGAADLPKTALGANISVSDASDSVFQKLRVYGKTTQDGTPTPDDPAELVSVGAGGSIGVTVTGKNLFDISSLKARNTNTKVEVTGNTLRVYSASTSGTNHATISRYITLRRGITYTVSCDLLVAPKIIGKTRIALRNRSGVILAGVYFAEELKQYKFSYTPSEDIDCEPSVLVTSSETGVMGDVTVSNIQVEANDHPTDYEPYTGQDLSVSTPNGLPGIPVSSGGNYTDADGQQWICDVIDLGTGMYEHHTIMATLDDTQTLVAYNASSFGDYLRLWYDIGDFERVSNTTLLSNRLTAHINSNDNGIYIATGTPQSNPYVIALTLEKAVVGSTAADARAWLAAHPIKVIAARTDVIAEPLAAETLAAYAALRTNEPNTTVYNDAGAYMAVGYYTQTATMLQVDIERKFSYFLPKSGGTMTGSISMDGNKLTDMPTPTASGDAVPKSYADNFLPKSGGTVTGAIAMSGNKMTGLGTPTASADAATKSYVDGKSLVFSNTTVAASAWASNTDQSGAGFGYRASVALTGVTASMIPDVYFSAADAVSGNFSPAAQSYAGGVYIYAASKPTAAITIPTIRVTK